MIFGHGHLQRDILIQCCNEMLHKQVMLADSGDPHSIYSVFQEIRYLMKKPSAHVRSLRCPLIQVIAYHLIVQATLITSGCCGQKC